MKTLVVADLTKQIGQAGVGPVVVAECALERGVFPLRMLVDE